MAVMTPSDKRVLEAIQSLTGTFGYPPTIREIGKECGMTSPATVSRHLNRLRDEGWVTWEEGHVRTIRRLR